jgi:hypothetical protein
VRQIDRTGFEKLAVDLQLLGQQVRNLLFTGTGVVFAELPDGGVDRITAVTPGTRRCGLADRPDGRDGLKIRPPSDRNSEL